ncbi:MAG: hypothetical protein ACOX6T_03600 [Myxococcales bacterium]
MLERVIEHVRINPTPPQHRFFLDLLEAVVIKGYRSARKAPPRLAAMAFNHIWSSDSVFWERVIRTWIDAEKELFNLCVEHLKSECNPPPPPIDDPIEPWDVDPNAIAAWANALRPKAPERRTEEMELMLRMAACARTHCEAASKRSPGNHSGAAEQKEETVPLTSQSAPPERFAALRERLRVLTTDLADLAEWRPRSSIEFEQASLPRPHSPLGSRT